MMRSLPWSKAPAFRWRSRDSTRRAVGAGPACARSGRPAGAATRSQRLHVLNELVGVVGHSTELVQECWLHPIGQGTVLLRTKYRDRNDGIPEPLDGRGIEFGR